MTKSLSKIAFDYLPPVGFIFLLIILWQVFVQVFNIPSFIIASPTEVWTATVQNWGRLWYEMIFTVEEILLGFAGGVAIGLGLAVLVVSSKLLARILNPLITAAQVVPKVALAPVFLIWFGYGELSKIVIAVVICFFPVVLNSIKGFTTVDKDLIDLLHSLYASRTQIFLKAQLPNAMPYFMASVKIAMTFAVIGAVVGEWIGANVGIGYIMLVASSNFQNGLLYAAIILISVVGIILVLALEVADKFLVRWSQPTDVIATT